MRLTYYTMEAQRVQRWYADHGASSWGVLASDGQTVLALAEPWQGKTFEQVRAAVGEAAWRAATSNIAPNMGILSAGGTERAEAPESVEAEADWICEGCPFRAERPGVTCVPGAYCVHESPCSRRGKLQRGEVCPAGFWLLLPGWIGKRHNVRTDVLARHYAREVDHA
jgi:hypothetical protein